jgi:hypothetical protein
MMRLFKFLKRKHFESKLPKEVLQIILDLKREDICVNVGANVGLVSEVFLTRGAEVYAFEPHPGAFAKLLKVKKNYENFTPLNQSAGIANG